MMLQNKTRTWKAGVVTLSLLFVAGMLYAQSTKSKDEKQTKSTERKLTDGQIAEIADKLYNGEGLKIKGEVPEKGIIHRDRNKPKHAPLEGNADVEPQFDGDLIAYLGKNIVYPKSARAKKIQGKVLVRFTININGTLEDIKVLKSPNDELSLSALEVVRKMPRWKPAARNGRPIEVDYIMPISYKL